MLMVMLLMLLMLLMVLLIMFIFEGGDNKRYLSCVLDGRGSPVVAL